MPEIGAIMRAIELQRLVENKVTEWRERSARVMSAGAGARAGAGMAASYQSSNFKRHTNHRKNSAEIKRIIAKYSHRDGRQRAPSPPPPARPPRNKKLKYSQSEDNLAAMDLGQVPRFQPEPPPRFNYTRSKYNAKSCEDLSAFVDVERAKRSKNFEVNSIMNARDVQPRRHTQSYSVVEEVHPDSKYDDFDIRDDPKLVTSTPIPQRRSRPESELLSDDVRKRNKCSDMKKGSSEPNILRASVKTTASTSTLDAKKKWTILKQPFKKGTFDCLVLWKRRKTRAEPTRLVFADLVNVERSTNDLSLSKQTEHLAMENITGINFADKENKEPELDNENYGERRIINLFHFFDSLKNISNHSPAFGCTLLNLNIVSEKRAGLNSTLKLKCNMCNAIFFLNTCKSDSKDHFDVNKSAISGITTTGIGLAQFNELLAALNIPRMTQNMFDKINKNICLDWEKTAAISMEKAAEREREAATKTHNGIAVIDVIVDGCWSKRSYKKNYNALSGAAVIIGRKFGEVLYLGVKNKYCCICARAATKETTPKEHICFKNYSGSSTNMESKILVEGFRTSVNTYNIIYGRMIADGDSSTYKSILDARPYVDYTVEKIECRNHLLRNMCNKLQVISTNKAYPLTSRKLLTTQRILAIRKVICLSIKENKKSQEPLTKRINNLYVDVCNAPNHAFGDHEHCQKHYCESERKHENLTIILKNTSFWIRLNFVVGVVAANSRSLINDVDSNPAEHFNSIVAKFVGGKRVNLCLRQGYQARCSAAVVAYNTKRPIYNLQKTTLACSPKSKSKNWELRKIQNNIRNRRYVRSKKCNNYSEKQKENGDKNYGEHCQKPDLCPEEFELLKYAFLKNLERTEKERDIIQKTTILQRESSEWMELRRQLLTASNFGKVILRRSTTNASIVKSLLYKTDLSHVASINHGVQKEKNALRQLAQQENMQIEPCGLFIDSEIPYLGATPDGLVGDDILIEIKCPITAYRTSIEEAIDKKKIRFWTKKGNTQLQINKRHPWYFQIQGQLHITKRKICLFAVWAGENKDLKVETIERDDEFWNKQMVQKLKQFYIDQMLPELVDPRFTRNMSIRGEKDQIQNMPLKRKMYEKELSELESEANSNKLKIRKLSFQEM